MNDVRPSQPKGLIQPKAAKLGCWLNCGQSSSCPYKFRLLEANELCAITSNTENDLAWLIVYARVDPDLLMDAAKILGWKRAIELLVRPSLPKVVTARHGDFGEVLISAMLVEFLGYSVPVQKLQFAISSGERLPGTDTIAIKRNAAGLIEVCFVETKTRTTNDSDAAVQAYAQLKKDYSQQIPDMIRFVVARLRDQKDPMYPDFLSYALDPSDTFDREVFLIGLVWEKSIWNENILMNLDQNLVVSREPSKTAMVVTINGLRDIIKRTFGLAGITEVIDDER